MAVFVIPHVPVDSERMPADYYIISQRNAASGHFIYDMIPFIVVRVNVRYTPFIARYEEQSEKILRQLPNIKY